MTYERVWPSATRRHVESMDTAELLRRYGADHRLLIVGDATMSPYEVTVPGGSVEHWNEEPGAVLFTSVPDAHDDQILLAIEHIPNHVVASNPLPHR